jgi:transposase-like protein
MAKKRMRSFDEEFKLNAVRRLEQGEPALQIAFDLEIPRKLLYDWKRRLELGKPLHKVGRPAKPKNETAEVDQERIAHLERLVGQLTVENHFFRTALRKFEPRNPSETGKITSPPTSGR